MATELAAHFGTAPALRIAALLLGHFLADFVFQTRRMVQEKQQWRGLLRHGLVVYLVHLAIFIPFISVRAVIILFALAVSHLVLDRLKILIEGRTGPSLLAFGIDQLLHIAIAVAVGLFLAHDPSRFDVDPELFIRAAVVLSGAAFLATGGSAMVRLILRRTGAAPDDAGAPTAGHFIGILERLILFVLVLVDQWAAAGLVIAAKSLARFENLKERPFAEYYLVGTLTSVLLAVLVGLLVASLI